MRRVNKHQRDQSIGFMPLCVVVFVDWYIEKNDTVKKIKSILFHQVGAASQPSLQQEFAIKISGVTKQCMTHSILAIAPIESGF